MQISEITFHMQAKQNDRLGNKISKKSLQIEIYSAVESMLLMSEIINWTELKTENVKMPPV